MPLAHKPPPPAADYKSDVHYGNKHEDKKQEISGLGLDAFPALQKKDKNPYASMGAAALGPYDDKKDRKVGAFFFWH
jgi:hypothetical protein